MKNFAIAYYDEEFGELHLDKVVADDELSALADYFGIDVKDIPANYEQSKNGFLAFINNDWAVDIIEI